MHAGCNRAMSLLSSSAKTNDQNAPGANRVTGTRLSDAKYHDVAAAFGARGQHVTRIEDLRPAIKSAFASKEPACINVEIDLAPMPPELHLLMSR